MSWTVLMRQLPRPAAGLFTRREVGLGERPCQAPSDARFTDEETEARRGEVRSLSGGEAELELGARPRWPGPPRAVQMVVPSEAKGRREDGSGGPWCPHTGAETGSSPQPGATRSLSGTGLGAPSASAAGDTAGAAFPEAN